MPCLETEHGVGVLWVCARSVSVGVKLFLFVRDGFETKTISLKIFFLDQGATINTPLGMLLGDSFGITPLGVSWLNVQFYKPHLELDPHRFCVLGEHHPCSIYSIHRMLFAVLQDQPTQR